MRIAFYAPMKPPDHPVPSGDRRMARLLLEALRTAGHEVEVACRFRGREATGEASRQERLRRAGSWLATKLVARFAPAPPDAWVTYHLYYKAPDWIGPRVCRDLGIPYCIAEASHAPKRAGGPWDLAHRTVAAALEAADLLISPNRADLPCVRPLLRPGVQVLDLPPFVEETGTPDRTRARRDLARELDLDETMPWLLTVAMMRPGDKLDSYRRLADALARLEGRPFVLLAAGDGAARTKVEAACADLPTRFLGAVEPPRLKALYAACDLFVWPAVNEAWGMVFLEAQAAGLPVVGGRTGGVPDVVGDGETGLLVPVDDPAAFAAAVAELLDTPGRRVALGAAARARITDRHSLDAASRRLDAALRRVVR